MHYFRVYGPSWENGINIQSEHLDMEEMTRLFNQNNLVFLNAYRAGTGTLIMLNGDMVSMIVEIDKEGVPIP